MISLAQITRETRTISKFGAIALAAILFLFFSFKVVVFIIGRLNPPQVAPPDMKYGELVSTLPIQTQKPSYSYQANTLTGSLPNFPSRLRVYKTLKPEPDLLTLQKTRDTVDNLGYDLNTEILVQPSEYRWTNAAGGTITYNTLHKNFSLTSGIPLDDPNYRLGDKKAIVLKIMSFVQSLGASTTGIDQSDESVQVEYYRSDGINLIPEEASRAYLAQVNLYQNKVKVDPFTYRGTQNVLVETLPIYYEDQEKSNQTFLVKAASKNTEIITGVYMHFPVDTTDYGIYPIKSSEEAFEDLKNGNAYILSNSEQGTISITDVQLGYFIPKSYTEYVMPIFVFSGTDFLAYVNAVGEYTPSN